MCRIYQSIDPSIERETNGHGHGTITITINARRELEESWKSVGE